MDNVYTIGITGGSGSGKTTFLHRIIETLGEENVCMLSQDHYYLTIDKQPRDRQGIENFDLPESFDLNTFREDIFKLKRGEAVSRQEYTFNNPKANPETLTFKPAPILIVEGIFSLHDAKIAETIDLKVFVEAKDYIKVKRRILRDQVERGYDLQDVLYRYENHVMPAYERYIEHHKHEADLVICNNTSFNRALEVITIFLQSKI